MVTNRAALNAFGQGRTIASIIVRVVLGTVLFIHAVFHALPGMNATQPLQAAWSQWLWTAVWTVAAVGLVGASYGLWGWGWFARRWRFFALVGSIASFFILARSGILWAWIGAVGDVLVIGYAVSGGQLDIDAEPKKVRHPFWRGFVRVFGTLMLLYGGLAIALHPWMQNWGASDGDIATVWPSDEGGTRNHLINHVIPVRAPAEKVWPYIVQIGQDKAGFYSYDWLERAAGDDVHNVHEVRSEWQNLKAGDVVRLTQPNYLGGLVPEGVPLKVIRVEPNRMLQLEGWGTFWIENVPGGNSRLGIRSSVGDVPFWAAPIELFGFEPPHFIMEQRMLRTIKELAER